MDVTVDYTQLNTYAKQLENLGRGGEFAAFCRRAVKNLAARHLAVVKRTTPVGKYTVESGRTSGTLRKNWSAKSIKYDFKPGFYGATLINPTKYASYVEHGHRQTPGRYVPVIKKRLKRRWVKGRFFVKAAEKETQSRASQYVRLEFLRFLKGSLT